MTGGTVVVLGQAGRNFAAGMSGGIAFVLDEAGDFSKRCNLAMVELEAVPAEEAQVQHAGDMAGELEKHGRVEVNHLEQSDVDILLTLITRHQKYTGSSRAREILANLGHYLPKFVKIMPTEYRRALAEMAATQPQIPVRAPA
jgi:glutamate synthase (NADPH/NADH) large chain